MSEPVQTSFNSPIERTEEILQRAQRQIDDYQHVVLAISGGTDSIVAANVMCELGPKYGFKPTAVAHINTGAALPQSRLVAKVFAEMHDLEYIEQGPRNQRNALAPRILRSGWPGSYPGHPSELGHGREWANRKEKPMQGVYMHFEGNQVWVSGVRKLESKRRSGTVSDGAIDNDKARRTWVSPIVGWTEAEKKAYIKKHNLPVSEGYLVLGFSAECVACAFDDKGLLTDLDLLAPELSYCIKSLAVWLGQLAIKGEVDIEPKQLCWGWEVGKNEEPKEKKLEEPIAWEWEEVESGKFEMNKYEGGEKTQEIIGCSAGSCATRNAPEWIMNLPNEQIIDRLDVEAHWNGRLNEVVGRFA